MQAAIRLNEGLYPRLVKYTKCFLILAVQFQIWDGLMTHVFVNHNVVTEFNPVMSPMIGSGEFLLLKFIGAIACIPALLFLYKLKPRVALMSTLTLAAFYLGIVSWNFSVIFTSI